MTVVASMSGLPERLAGRYRVVGTVGRGAIAEVVRARDERTGAEVALKILYAHLRENAAVVERFRREVDIVRKVSHPHVLAIHEVVESDGQLFLVMDFCPGGDLADRLAAKRAFAAGELTDLAAQLCGALAAAHRAGVVHRDVKPSNVLCGAGPQLDVRLCDFGLARTAELSGLTTANAVLGTPEYMAPEVVVDGHADPRSDIYSLGVMLFEAATGRLPFYGDSPYQLMRQHVDVEAPRARSLAPDLPLAIDGAIARALAKDPLDRFATAEDLARAVAADGAAPLAHAAVAPPGAARKACPTCGGWLVEAAAACADCGAALIRLEDAPDGGVSVLVTGPGKAGDKIDARRYVALFKLLDELPARSVSELRGGRRAPRVPFYVARGVTERSAASLVQRLHAIGLEARVDTRWAFLAPEMRRKLTAMTARHTVGGGALFVVGNQFLGLITHLSFTTGSFVGGAIFLAWAGTFAAVAYRYTRPLVRSNEDRTRERDASLRLADALARLRARQDRRLVGRILDRRDRLGVLGRKELGDPLVERGALLAGALANLDSLRDADASVSRDAARALAELRGEEVTRVVLRADLLRVASRLDDICLILARAAAATSAEEAEHLERQLQELGLAIEAAQEVAAALEGKS